MLGRLGLQLACSPKIGHEGEVYAYGIASHLPLHLTDGFQIGRTLDIADCASDFGDDEIGGNRFLASAKIVIGFCSV